MSEETKNSENGQSPTSDYGTHRDDLGAAPDASAKPKKSHKKGWAIAGIVVAVLLVCGIGAWNWHNTPGFCGTVCHYSMYSYVEAYEQQAGAMGKDEYGNQVTNTSAMLSVSHKDDGLACLDCHEPSVPQQMGEVAETLTGDYFVAQRSDGKEYVALREVDSNALIKNAGGLSDHGDAFCLKSGCHVTADGRDYTRDTLTELTKDMAFNPHRWIHGNIQCTDCHKSHRASVFYCTRCHNDAYQSMPDGWVSYDEGQQILEAAEGQQG